eukprot:TRINITY_DN7636_c0_g1_i1.p1 TRINITY_DN7636_c0_g1~~TRINITY_DN7636_c0_g1_i1.p1  ORF type:complete len:582 (-),score=181.09 TRINITY_DN7636_c0_g1_i1:50-1795(-)
MFRGTVDRAGNREGKKTSLRKTGKVKKTSVDPEAKQELTRTAPHTLTPPGENGIIDCGANLVNRQFESDQQRVIQRALASNINTIIIVPNDYEKVPAAISLAKYHTGTCYVCVGMHPNNITAKKLSDKQYGTLIDDLRGLLMKPEVVAITTGLDFGRDYGLRFPQEKFLKSQLELSGELDLPVLLHETGATDVLIDLLKGARGTFGRGMIYNFRGTADQVKSFNDMGLYIGLSGALCEASTGAFMVQEVLPLVPRDKLLLCSDAPYHTPHNIPDPFVREAKNEPSNLPFVLDVIAKAWGCSTKDAAAQIRKNSKEFYALKDVGDEGVEESVDPTAATSSSTSSSTPLSASSTPKVTSQPTPSDGAASTSESSESEEEEEKGPSAIQYACKMCRTKLFTSEDIITHSAAVEGRVEYGMGRKGKGDKENVEEGCTMHFVSCMPWMNDVPPGCKADHPQPPPPAKATPSSKKPISDATTSEDNKGEAELEGKVQCPKCDQKLGKWSLVGIQCSCGVVVAPPAFKIVKSRVDVLADAATAGMHDLDIEDNSDGEDTKKKGKKKTKFAKERRKERKTNFRNKDFVI